MKYRVITERPAEADLAEIFHWIARDSPVNAARWQNALERLIDSLGAFPERCAFAPESEAFNYQIRQLLHGNYRILFTIREQAVYVLHVRHGARQQLTPEGET